MQDRKNEAYLHDFAPEEYQRPDKKVSIVWYSMDKGDWYKAQVQFYAPGFSGWITGIWMKFEYYDGSWSQVLSVPAHLQEYNQGPQGLYRGGQRVS